MKSDILFVFYISTYNLFEKLVDRGGILSFGRYLILSVVGPINENRVANDWLLRSLNRLFC